MADNAIELPGGLTEVAINHEYWQERLYKSSDAYDTDAKFWENQGKSAYLEGKMGARELSYSKGGGLPSIVPLSGAAGPQPPG